eukprot:137286_1
MFCGIRNDKMVKKANWTTRFKYNIICLHPSCKTFSGWNTRMNMASFNKHYGNVHKIKGQGAVRQGQVVSHWAITKDFYGNIKRVQEYRLIDVKSLEFIDDTDPTVADVDMHLIQNNNIVNNPNPNNTNIFDLSFTINTINIIFHNIQA